MEKTTPLQERVVQAAVKLFAGRGFHGTSIRAIACAAGVSIGAIYHHYRSKEEVFLAILRREYERRRTVVEELKAQGMAPKELVRCVASVHFELLDRHQDSVKLLAQTLPTEHPRLQARLRALEEEYAGYVAELLREGMLAAQIRQCHALTAAHALLGMAKAVTARALEDDAVGHDLRVRGPEELAEFAWRALCP